MSNWKDGVLTPAGTIGDVLRLDNQGNGISGVPQSIVDGSGVISNLKISTGDISISAGGRLTASVWSSGPYCERFGDSSGRPGASCSSVTVFGCLTGGNITSGSNNTLIGFFSGGSTSTGGSNSGLGSTSGLTNTTGSKNTWLGANADSNGQYNGSAAIGYNAIIGASNAMILGGTATDSVQVGINTIAPIGQFDVIVNSASRIGQIIKGAASRTAALLNLQTSAGDSLGNVGGCIFQSFADAGNNSGTGETDLYSYTTVANSFAINGDKIRGKFGGVFANALTAAVRLRLYFAGTLIFDSSAFTLSALVDWELSVVGVRVSSTVMRFISTMITMGTTGATMEKYTEVTGLTLTATNIFKLTGQSSGTGNATNDIVAKLGSVELIPAA